MEAFIKKDNLLKMILRPIKFNLYLLYSWRDKWPYYLFSITNKQNMPDVIIVGLPKTSTTWVAHTLEKHGDITLSKRFRPNRGETNFFKGFIFKIPIKKYFSFNKSLKKADKILIEKSPTYANMSIYRLKLIKKLNPDVKIILGFREPLDWLISYTKMEMTESNNKIYPLNENLDLFEHYYCWKRNKYRFKEIYNNWNKVFSNNLCVVDFYQVKSNPQQVMEEVIDFLNLSKDGFFKDEYSKRVNKTPDVKWPVVHVDYINKLFKDDIIWYERSFTHKTC